MKPHGNKFPVTSFISEEAFLQLENARGILPRSCFIALIIEEVLNVEHEPKEGETKAV